MILIFTKYLISNQTFLISILLINYKLQQLEITIQLIKYIRMKTNSNKKSTDFIKYGQSRVLITSLSLNPLSKNISSKLDLIKQEISRQYHEKFPTEKKRATSTKKSTSSSKHKAKEQRSTIDPLSRKLNFNRENESHGLNMGRNYTNISAQQKESGDTYRSRYYQMQDKLFQERQKAIDTFEKSSLLKQNIIEFLQQPNKKTAAQLKNHFTNQRHCKIIEKFMSMNEEIQYTENIVKEVLRIMEVEDIQTLFTELRNRQCKNLSQASFKILQLQTAYNKLEGESQEKLKQIIQQQNKKEKQLKIELEQQALKLHHIVEQAKKQEQEHCRKLLNNLIREISCHHFINMADEASIELEEVSSTRAMFVTFDRSPKKKQSISSSIRSRQNLVVDEIIQYTCIQQQIQTIYNIFKELQSSLYDIQTEAEQNLEKLKTSKQDMDRLQKLIENVTRQTEEQKNKMVEHFELKLEEKDRLYENMEQKLKESLLQKEEQFVNLEKQYNRVLKIIEGIQQIEEKFKVKTNELQEKLSKRDQIINKIIKIVCEATGQDTGLFGFDTSEGQLHLESQISISEIVINKMEVVLKKHLLSLKENLQSAQNLILWHEKQLQIKENLLKEFEFNLKKLVEDSEIGHQKEKQISFERDQYKYLLNNLRENVREMKIQYEEKIQKTIEDKDKEYLNSNKDILIENQRLNDQVNKFEKEIRELKEQLKSQSASHDFYRKKSQQFESSLFQMRKKLLSAETEAAKHQQCLKQIQTQFKEVENMSERTSQRIQCLETENKQISTEAHELRTKSKTLITQIQTKDQNYNKLVYAFEEMKKRYQAQVSLKQDLQIENSNLRIKNLQTVEEQREKLEECKKVQIENVNLSKENKKLIEEVNSLTKKLINYMNDEKKSDKIRFRIREQIKKNIKEEVKKLQQQYKQFRSTINEEVEEVKKQIMDQLKQVAKQLNEHFESNINHVQTSGHDENKFENNQDVVEFMSPQFIRIRKTTYEESEEEKNNREENEDIKEVDKLDRQGQVRENNIQEVEKSQAYRVKSILKSLKDLEQEEPKIPYFDFIRNQYKELKKKLIGKNLHLDISAVSHKPQTISSSPTSISFGRDFLFDKRCNTEPNEDFAMGVGPKQTNRSETKNDRSSVILRKEIQVYKQQIQKLEQIINSMDEREEQLKIRISQLQQEKIQLQNGQSIQVRDGLLISILKNLYAQKWTYALADTRGYLRSMKIQNEETKQTMENFEEFINRIKKKNSPPSLISGLFTNNAKP